jgi:hypothetical protein
MRGASGDTQSCSAARPCQRGWEGRLQGADGTWRVLCDCSARTGKACMAALAAALLRSPDSPRSVSQTRLAPPRPAWLSPVSPPGRLAPSPRPASLRPRGPPCYVPAGPPRSGTRRGDEPSEAARRGRSKAGRGDGARRAGGTERGGDWKVIEATGK